MSLTFIENLSQQEHDQFVSNHFLCNLSQLSSWGEVKKEWEKQIVALEDDGNVVASAQCFIRKLPLGLSMVYITRGPILDYSNQEVVTTFFSHLKSHFKKLGCIMIKFDPPIHLQQASFNEFERLENPTSDVIESLKKVDAIHQGFDLNLYRYAQPRYLAVLSKEKFEAQGFSSGTKRNIKRANKKGVELQRIDQQDIKRFAKIVEYTEKRKNIGLRNQEYFTRMIQAFPKTSYVTMAILNQRKSLNEVNQEIQELENKIVSLTKDSGPYKKSMDQLSAANKEKKRLMQNIAVDGDVVDIAGIFAIKTPNSVDLLYMGLNDRYKKYLAPHLLYNDAILWGFNQGVDTIDFGGVAGTLDDGLSQFKAGFNADVVEMIGEFDIVLSPLLYKLYESGWPKVKKMMLFIKRKQS